MSNHFFLAVLLGLAIALLWMNTIDGQKVTNMRCKERPVQQNFDLKRVCHKG